MEWNEKIKRESAETGQVYYVGECVGVGVRSEAWPSTLTFK